MSAYITVIGNLGADPETGTTPTGAEHIKLRVAVNNRRGQTDSTDWYSVTAWGGTAKGLATLAGRGILRKGTKVMVVGQLTTRAYTDRTGQPRTSLDITAQAVELAGSPQDAGTMQGVPF